MGVEKIGLPGRRWLPAPGHEAYYLISDHGEIFSIRSQRINKLGWQSAGYLQGHLHLDGKDTSWLMHRLVAVLFVENPFDLPQVNHIDGDKRNNHYSNLEWCECRDNILHAIATGLNDPYQSRQAVVGVPIEGGEPVYFHSMKAADMAFSKSGKNGGNVSLAVSGKISSAYGRKWSRVRD